MDSGAESRWSYSNSTPMAFKQRDSQDMNSAASFSPPHAAISPLEQETGHHQSSEEVTASLPDDNSAESIPEAEWREGLRRFCESEDPPVVLVDMDNTLVNWELQFQRLMTRHYPQIPIVPPVERTQFKIEMNYDDKYREYILRLPSLDEFWLSMDPIEGAVQALKSMVALGILVFIVTTPDAKHTSRSAFEKIAWVEKHLGPEWKYRSVLTHDKTLVTGDILIDDRPAASVGLLRPSWTHTLFAQPYNLHRGQCPRLNRWQDWGPVLYRVLVIREQQKREALLRMRLWPLPSGEECSPPPAVSSEIPTDTEGQGASESVQLSPPLAPPLCASMTPIDSNTAVFAGAVNPGLLEDEIGQMNPEKESDGSTGDGGTHETGDGRVVEPLIPLKIQLIGPSAAAGETLGSPVPTTTYSRVSSGFFSPQSYNTTVTAITNFGGSSSLMTGGPGLLRKPSAGSHVACGTFHRAYTPGLITAPSSDSIKNDCCGDSRFGSPMRPTSAHSFFRTPLTAPVASPPLYRGFGNALQGSPVAGRQGKRGESASALLSTVDDTAVPVNNDVVQSDQKHGSS